MPAFVGIRTPRSGVWASGLVLAAAVALWAACPSPLLGNPGASLFRSNTVLRVEIEMDPSALDSLRDQPRTDVRASIRASGKVYPDVGIHLKGSTGSFRGIDDKPSLTLDFDQFDPKQRLHGLSKIHLNNSVEDPSYLCEALGAELFRAAGVPAPRVAHAMVDLNGKPLGLYVLKEGFTREFLGLYFQRTDGNLYDTGSGNEVTEPMKRNFGEGPGDHSDLKAVALAAQEPDLGKRWARLQQSLDVDRFLSFMAMEILAGHRDGYCLARNNFRIYQDTETHRLVFLPQGLDNLFGRADLPVQPRWSGLVAQAVMETPEGRRRYRERLGTLFTNTFDLAALGREIDQKIEIIRPCLDSSDGRLLAAEATALKERIAGRMQFIAQQLSQPEPSAMRFENDVVKLRDWRAVDPPAGGRLAETGSPDGKRALLIRAGPFTAASWRTKVVLQPGRYRFEALARTQDVTPLNFGRSKGAGLRVSGAHLPQPHHLTGTVPWTRLELEFPVTKALDEVELLCELRASQGDAWFALDSLLLVRLP